MRIANAATDEEFLRCLPVLTELRPHLRPAEFVEQVGRQQRDGGYRMSYLEDDGRVRAVAGWRIGECLAWGRFAYVDDLVSLAADRARGYGGKLFDWVIEQARAERCGQLHLDSGVQRFGAHRFYLGKRMDLTSHHFALSLVPKDDARPPR